MVVIAASLYLPEHILFITRRAFYYVAGDYEHSTARISQTMIQTAASSAVSLSSSIPSSVKDAVETVKEALKGRGPSAVPEL